MLNGDSSIGRIVSVTGGKAILMLDPPAEGSPAMAGNRPEMGTLLAIDTSNTIVLAIVSALSVPVPAQRDGEGEIWIAELNLVGELSRDRHSETRFNRGVTSYPALGDRVRIAAKSELQLAFYGFDSDSVRVGTLRQDSTIPAIIKVDDLLGKHFAILGTTGTGKSCGTALILRAILDKHPAAHIVLLDPHNEYASAFQGRAEVISPRNLQLPFWLLTFEEAVEVLIGDVTRKAEIEILQELIPLAKARYGIGRSPDAVNQRLRRPSIDPSRYTIDSPVPYRISDLVSLIDERMGKLENKRDLAPYRQLRAHIESISSDVRYAFMFGSVTVYDGMAQILGRIFRVPVDNKPITILELTGLPTEIINVVVSVICRMTFDFALWGEGQVPVTLVCEEAHRYIPANTDLGFEPCKRAIARIAKEGRKYGASLCIVTQRPAEIDPTILSQCNNVFALRMSNDRDQNIVKAAVSDPGSGLLEFLPALGQREAIAFGDGVSLPVRIHFDELPEDCLPRSAAARFTHCWQQSIGDQKLLEHIVERWRSLGSGQVTATTHELFAESLAVSDMDDRSATSPSYASTSTDNLDEVLPALENIHELPEHAPYAPRFAQPAPASTAKPLRPPEQTSPPPLRAVPQPQRANAPPATSAALKSLRERLMQRPQR